MLPVPVARSLLCELGQCAKFLLNGKANMVYVQAEAEMIFPKFISEITNFTVHFTSNS